MDYVGMDYVGDDELDELLGVSGDDDDDDVGARRPRVNLGSKKRMQAMQKAARARFLPAVLLGFRDSIAAAATEIVSSEPNVKLRPTDLIVRESNADDFVLTSIKIGRVDLITGSVGVPASIFTGSQQRPPISAPELEAGTNATISVENLTNAASLFLAAYTCLDLSRHPVSP